MERLIKRGAEAEIYLTEWRNRKAIIKRRIAKKYRIREIDNELREKRTKKEAIMLASARSAGVSVPIIYDLRIEEKEIVMQYIEGERLKDKLDSKKKDEQMEICRKIGQSISRLHSEGIIHGDITTSNLILSDNKIYFIDFGLSSRSEEIEDMGVDLHLLMEAFKSAHKNKNLFLWVREAYIKSFNRGKEVIEKVKEIERRGRYMGRVT
ncbi:MAG: KEOPS complex kinase/ATPase Bud32 [Candidatus Thermoplasmatota archaeon]